MEAKMVDVTLHLGEDTVHEQREDLRDRLLQARGIMAADYHDEKPHLMVVEYNPDVISSGEILAIAKQGGLHAELIGL
ncbi:MAG: ATP-binding protein [Gammaproteobacteria bacterium]|nr:ATP-binding protein [Gammaproteobacteria bacterium]NIR97182.1 ATP-binding protein [Gammaproteobacteria bacterium]NIT62899.1 ATP-binding protein [Gammaproteobacteria bacterium]NIV19864.1 ATP-binding protein [Gammaproteobacteria bacterium]NIY31479.1 ATP-binding protein [Gammaproteobacteria bacterium]